jgi:hypothetical protein
MDLKISIVLQYFFHILLTFSINIVLHNTSVHSYIEKQEFWNCVPNEILIFRAEVLKHTHTHKNKTSVNFSIHLFF